MLVHMLMRMETSQDVIDEVDAKIGDEDLEYLQAVTSFDKARSILDNARVARGFYLVLVPASSGEQSLSEAVRNAIWGHGRGASKGSG